MKSHFQGTPETYINSRLVWISESSFEKTDKINQQSLYRSRKATCINTSSHFNDATPRPPANLGSIREKLIISHNSTIGMWYLCFREYFSEGFCTRKVESDTSSSFRIDDWWCFVGDRWNYIIILDPWGSRMLRWGSLGSSQRVLLCRSSECGAYVNSNCFL